MRTFGFTEPLLKWTKSYLTGRLQRVVIEGQSSQWEELSAGVPQGSILGPLLFLIHMFDISQYIETNMYLFADDTYLMTGCHDPLDSGLTLRCDLATLNELENQWQVSFNPEKKQRA